ncbi:SRPBCC family protein [Phenylobacterium sp.]|uniref:SRPBCC family protein n=1 Tax=Phenylobacterium sp. TaxID=1871053 RepID=UPI0035B1A85E
MDETGEELDLGVLTKGDGFTEGRLTRVFDHSPAKVWTALTDPARIVEWLAPGEIADRVGGPAKLNFVDSGIVIDSQVTAYETPRLLEYSWSGPGEPLRPLRWEVEPEGDGSRLTLTLRVPEGEDAARSCAGWEAHLEMLAAALEGVPIKFPFERFKTTREAYKAMLA